jgi:fructokinase
MTGAVLGLGEVLWDVLPSGPQLGGAPTNFALHAAGLGLSAGVVTRVGADALGDAARQRLTDRGLRPDLVQTDSTLPTGTVAVTLSAAGVPEYIIDEPAAWDRIAVAAEALAAMETAAAVCFGSLAQRNPASRTAIRTLVAATPPSAWRVFDINLRQHYYEWPTIEASLELANVLKVNDTELPVIGELAGVSGTIEQCMRELARRFGLSVVAVTRGDRGSVLLRDGRFSDHAGHPAAVKDTVGAGDAFSAALCAGLLRGIDLDRTNDFANRVAAFVCESEGATPVLPPEWRHSD